MAIAIYFAILTVNPAPFVILDEIEAALDDVNVAKFARYLRGMSRSTQFIAITHRRGTMEEADVLYGVHDAGGGRPPGSSSCGWMNWRKNSASPGMPYPPCPVTNKEEDYGLF